MDLWRNSIPGFELFIESYCIECTHEQILYLSMTFMRLRIPDDIGVLLLSEYLLRFSTWQSRLDNIEGLTEGLTEGRFTDCLLPLKTDWLMNN